MSQSLAQLALRNAGEAAFRAQLARLSPELAAELPWRWHLVGRPEQLTPEGDWTTWLVMAGRGFGKTRTGAEQVINWAREHPGIRIALVARTAADTREVMVEGESGILARSPPDFVPHYEPSKRRVTWPNGTMGTTYSAEEPKLLRGPQHHKAWADEVAAWARIGGPKKKKDRAESDDPWDQLQFGLRLGDNPQCVVTTTPKPTRVIRELMADHRVDPLAVRLSTGTTYDNRGNLAPTFFEKVIAKYKDTRLGQQELFGVLLDDVPGALWTREVIERLRVARAPQLERVVVAIDPAASSGEDADQTGIIVAGLARHAPPGGAASVAHAYVLADRTCSLSPRGWATQAVRAYYDYGATLMVAEVNQGGEMVEAVIRGVDGAVTYETVRASRGKRLRAEPVAALYEQDRVHHIGAFEDLEDQMCQFTQDGFDGSPDRVDALVYAISALFADEWNVNEPPKRLETESERMRREVIEQQLSKRNDRDRRGWRAPGWR